MKKLLVNLFIIVLVLLNILQWQRWNNAILRDEIVYTDTIYCYDTVKVIKPIVRDSVVIRYITQQLPAVLPAETTTKADEPILSPTINDNSMTVQIPITQKKYTGRGYCAFVSGYMPSLDSLNLYPETKIVYVQPSRWSVGLQAGMGISKDGRWNPYLGLGVSYQLFRLKKRR